MIEIIATSPNDAKIIEKCGADRIELISAFSVGGLTPSRRIIESTLKITNIPVNIMIRPHAKSFVYTEKEIKAMKIDILTVKKLGANGVVIGVLNNQNEICESQLNELLTVCKDLEVTFHRAFDNLENKDKGIKVLSKYPQITTVLTSGGRGNITDNISTLKKLIQESKHIKIMVGGGLNFDNINRIIKETRGREFHFGTAVRYQKSPFANINEEKLKRLINMVNNLIFNNQ
ncbi:MAG: copper homeostasis protein CutC [Bacilli bacterium]|nr:copper homeostasis protein CutC [Bacilli bacterium]